jgi:hypothetical protein
MIRMIIARRMRLEEYLARWEVEKRRRFWWENLKKIEYLGNVCGKWANVIKMDCKET